GRARRNLSSESRYRRRVSSGVIPRESTPTTPAALRRTTHRFVLGGGKSSLPIRFSHLRPLIAVFTSAIAVSYWRVVNQELDPPDARPLRPKRAQHSNPSSQRREDDCAAGK